MNQKKTKTYHLETIQSKLNAEELKKIEERLKISKNWLNDFIIFIVILAIIPIIIILRLFYMDLPQSFVEPTQKALAIVGTVFISALSLFAYLMACDNKLLLEDFQQGEKEILIGKPAKKMSREGKGYKYELCFEDEKIRVDSIQFDSVREGKFVAIHRTPKSKYVVLVEDRGDAFIAPVSN